MTIDTNHNTEDTTMTTKTEYERGYAHGRAGAPLLPSDRVTEAYRRGHEDGYADHWADAYGDDADMEGLGLVCI